jgi:calcium-dependent protein kinase
MLFESEGSDTLKIIDFGMAARIQPDEFLTDRIGTPYFIAPEVIYKKYNEKCDIWSAGIIFYMMLTGICPFRAENEVDLMQNILRD